MIMRKENTVAGWALGVGLAALAIALVPGHAASQEGAVGEVTFTRDIAPLFQQNCEACHQPGQIGPMSLITYDQVRPWAPMIREKVITQEMPPYHYDTNIGIQELKEDKRLSPEEIATIVAWVDQGAPMGDPADMPPPVSWPDPAEWKFAEMFGQPDLVVPAKPVDIPATGQDLWWEPLVEVPLAEDRWLKAIEVKPSVPGRRVVHHANTTLYLPGADGELEGQGGRYTEYASGKLGEIIPEGAGRLLPANSFVRWSIHIFPNGQAIDGEVTELGFWFHPEDYEPEYVQDLANYRMDGDLDIPPHGTQMVTGYHSWDHPVRIDSFQPHMHLRGVASSLEIFYPDTGEREVVSMISNWNAEWQISHIYEDHVAPLVPAGAVMIVTQWYDNTVDNPHNPDPDVWVYRGSRTGDEMSHAWIAVTHLDQEGYERIKAEREAMTPVAQQQ